MMLANKWSVEAQNAEVKRLKVRSFSYAIVILWSFYCVLRLGHLFTVFSQNVKCLHINAHSLNVWRIQRLHIAYMFVFYGEKNKQTNANIQHIHHLHETNEICENVMRNSICFQAALYLYAYIVCNIWPQRILGGRGWMKWKVLFYLHADS